jgi:hypothetical protein
MQIAFTHDEAQLPRNMLQHRIEELDKEINRTDSLAFKRELRSTDRTMERILGRISAALERNSE